MRKRVNASIDPSLLAWQESPLKQKITVKNKMNSEILPLFIMPDNRIIVFTQSPIYKKVYHHLKAICEPLHRPKLVHEYKITKFSLYTAMVLHYTAE
jgi:hypothetical protein